MAPYGDIYLLVYHSTIIHTYTVIHNKHNNPWWKIDLGLWLVVLIRPNQDAHATIYNVDPNTAGYKMQNQVCGHTTKRNHSQNEYSVRFFFQVVLLLAAANIFVAKPTSHPKSIPSLCILQWEHGSALFNWPIAFNSSWTESFHKFHKPSLAGIGYALGVDYNFLWMHT